MIDIPRPILDDQPTESDVDGYFQLIGTRRYVLPGGRLAHAERIVAPPVLLTGPTMFATRAAHADAFFTNVGKGAYRVPEDSDALLRRKFRRIAADPVYIRDGFRCVFCDMDMLSSVDALLSITKDHAFPKASGGTHDNSNLVCCCRQCNEMKGHKPYRSVEAARVGLARMRAERARWVRSLRAAHR